MSRENMPLENTGLGPMPERNGQIPSSGGRDRYALRAPEDIALRPIVVVANALPAKPVATKIDADTGDILEWEIKKGDGGLVTALASQRGIWIGAVREGIQISHIMEEEGFAAAHRTLNGGEGFEIRGIHLTEEEVEHYYNGYANQMLWPLLHGSVGEIVLHKEDSEVFRRVSDKFADAIIKYAPQGAPVIINDYHQMLTAERVRKERPDLKLVYFLHVPFPPAEVLKQVEEQLGVDPQEHKMLLHGMLANDIVGFHISEYAENFAENVKRLFPDAVIEEENGKPAYIHFEGRRIKLGVYPISIDAKAFENAGNTPEVVARTQQIRDDYARKTKYAPEGEKIIFDVGRLDPIKGFLEGLENIRALLKIHPEMRGRFRFVEVAHDSRLDVPLYRDLKHRTEALVREINDEFRIVDENGAVVWEPVVHISRKLEQDTELLAWYKAADILRVTPLRDGMNLVAKEWFMVGRDDAVEILSRKAGAYEELHGAVLGVDPLDEDEVIKALRSAILSEEEGGLPMRVRIAMKAAGRQQVSENDVNRWMGKILRDALAL